MKTKMNNKVKALLMACCAVLLVFASVLGTLAYLTDTTEKVTNTFTVGKVDISLDKLPPNWTLGQRLEVFIRVGKPQTCVNIPSNLVSWKNNQPFVLAVVNGKITARPVKLGVRSQNKVEIVSGLQAGDKIVMQPQKNLDYVNRRVKK
jgi:predicted ribosomally synthesized peptide with SipW-like signal peptide